MAATRYSITAIVIHWVTAAALLLVIGLGLRMSGAGGTEKENALALHMSVGIAILLLTVLRISWRMAYRPPALPQSPMWEMWLARVVHVGFYVLLLAVPLLGWLNVSSTGTGFTMRLFGSLPWPALPGVAGRDDIGALAQGAHRVLAYGICALLVLHVAGAIKHHLADPDSGLTRILPGARSLLGWRTASLAGLLIALFTLGGGHADPLLPKAMRLVRSDAPPRPPIDPRRSPVFASLMQPILAEKCMGCHGERTHKGGLRVDSFAALAKGGEGGKVVAPGKAEESELVHRIMLPATHPHAMPPAGRPALSPAESQLILWWIGAGADDTSTILAANPPPLVQKILQEIGVRNESPVFAKPVAAADAQALEKLRQTFQVQPLFASGGFLQAQPRFDRDTSQPLQFEPLAGVAEQLVWLDLSGANVPQEQLAVLARLRKLQRLNLSGTRADDRTVSQLVGLPYLEILNLYATGITDSSFAALGRMPSLTAVYLTGTAVSPAAVEQFARSRPDVRVTWQATPQDDSVTIKDRSDIIGEKRNAQQAGPDA